MLARPSITKAAALCAWFASCSIDLCLYYPHATFQVAGAYRLAQRSRCIRTRLTDDSIVPRARGVRFFLVHSCSPPLSSTRPVLFGHYLRYISSFHIFCGPIPVLSNGTGGTIESSVYNSLASLGQAVSACNLKRGVWIVKA